MAEEQEFPKEVEELLNDDNIRQWYQSRDPNRKKVNPFIDEETSEMYAGKASPLKTVEEEEEKVYGVSFSEHMKHIREVSWNFTWIGMSIGLIIAVVLAVIF